MPSQPVVSPSFSIHTQYRGETFSFPLNVSDHSPSLIEDRRLLIIDDFTRKRLKELFPAPEENPLTIDRFRFVQNLVLGPLNGNVLGRADRYTATAHLLFEELFNIHTTLVLVSDNDKPHAKQLTIIQPSKTAFERMDGRVRPLGHHASRPAFYFHSVLQTKGSGSQSYAVDLGAQSPEEWDSWYKTSWISSPKKVQELILDEWFPQVRKYIDERCRNEGAFRWPVRITLVNWLREAHQIV